MKDTPATRARRLAKEYALLKDSLELNRQLLKVLAFHQRLSTPHERVRYATVLGKLDGVRAR